MSSWEQDQQIHAEISPKTGEVMLSASDVVAWLRVNTECVTPCYLRPVITKLADLIVEHWLEATSSYVDRSGS